MNMWIFSPVILFSDKAVFEKATEMGRDNYWPEFIELFNECRYAESIECLNKVIEISSNPIIVGSAYFNLGGVLPYLTHDFSSDCLQAFKRAAALLSPNSFFNDWFSFMQVWGNEYSREEYLESLTLSTLINPMDAWAWRNIASINARQVDYFYEFDDIADFLDPDLEYFKDPANDDECGQPVFLKISETLTYHAPYPQDKITYLKNIPYADYLATDHWRHTRGWALARAKFACQVCKSTHRLQVHHNTYENRGCEKPEDLIVLCSSCHKLFHDNGSLST